MYPFSPLREEPREITVQSGVTCPRGEELVNVYDNGY
jgi:hypothetical protein